MVLMTFTNFFVNDEFIEFLEISNSVDVSIAGPADIMKHFDIVEDTFSLQGFKESNKRAVEACQDKAQHAKLQLHYFNGGGHENHNFNKHNHITCSA